MKVEKKLALFTQITMQEVEEKRLQLKKEIDEAFTGAVEEAVRTAEKQARERVRMEEYKIDRATNKEIIEAITAAKRSLVEKREMLMDALFQDVTDDLRAFIQKPEYQDWLVREIQAAQEKSQGVFAYVQVMARDACVLHEGSDGISSLTAEYTDEDFLGGFRLFSANRNIIDDQTLLYRLNEARREFIFGAGISSLEAVL